MHHVLLLAGDGIGPEIIAQGKKILDLFPELIRYEEGLIGGAAIDAGVGAYPEDTATRAKQADAVLLGAVGGEKWNTLPLAERPESGLLKIRKDLGLYANLRPLTIWPSLSDLSPLKKENLEDVDLVVVRELTSDLYFGQPRQRLAHEAWNTMRYTTEEIERIAHVAFQIAQKRPRKKVCSIDKANVLETMGLWRDTVSTVHAEYPDVELTHMYVDNAAMQLIKNPSQFDVLLTPNMFGDILSDEASVLAGSLGLLPSASFGDKHSLFEPIHGSAPDIAGQDKANPIGLLCSIAMMFDLTFKRPDLMHLLQESIQMTLNQGLCTADLVQAQETSTTTTAFGDAVVENLKKILL